VRLICRFCGQPIRYRLLVHIEIHHPKVYAQLKSQEKHRYGWH